MGDRVMSMNASELLRAAGWTPARQVSTREVIGALEALGIDIVPSAQAFLAHYGGLDIRAPDDAFIIIGGDITVQAADVQLCAAYARRIGTRSTPVGLHSYATLLIDEAGELWGGVDNICGLVGKSLLEAVDQLLIDVAPPPFDLVVDE